MSALPLDGVRVIDLTVGLAGSRCTKTLAELGADVIKVEPVDGDEVRRLGPFADDKLDPEASLLFLYFNINKRGITLNLETESGKELLKKLVAKADILVESFPAGTMERLGLGYDVLSQINPLLVMTSVSWFGQTGEYKDFQATDLIIYALAGQMYVSGKYQRHPLTHAFSQAQHAGGMNGAVATLAAFHHQQEAGEGQYVDVSIFESVANMVQLPPLRYSYTGAIETRGPKEPPKFVRGFIKVKDGYIGLNASGRNTWEFFAEFLGIPELLSDKFNTGAARSINARELNALLDKALANRGKEEFWHSAVANSFTFQMVQRPEEAITSPQLEARGYQVDVSHPRIGTVKLPGDTYGFSETPWHVRRRAPLLGEHNAEVYGELGYTLEQLTNLRESGVI